MERTVGSMHGNGLPIDRHVGQERLAQRIILNRGSLGLQLLIGIGQHLAGARVTGGLSQS